MATKVIGVRLDGCTVVAMLLGSVRGSALGRSAKCRNHVLGEQMLRLDTLPVLQTPKVRDDRQFTNSALFFETFDLADYLFRRADEADLLFHNLVVRELGQRLQRAAGIKPYPFATSSAFFFSS